jgi:hypothetical protein
MIKLTHIVTAALALAALGAFSGTAVAESGANTSTKHAALHIRVMVVPVVITDQTSKVISSAAVSYSIPTNQPPMSVTKEVRNVRSSDGKSVTMVEMTTFVVE